MPRAKLIVVVGDPGGHAALVATAAECNDLEVLLYVPTSTEAWAREHLPRTLFAQPQFPNAAAILECRASDAGGAFGVFCETAAAAGLGALGGYRVEEHVVLQERDSGPDA